MKIKIWGCRGSLATPGSATLRYGGNTTCLEIRDGGGRLVVVDAGSGARDLGKAILADPSVSEITLVLTHSHWDHLAGFPFFSPVYLPQYTISICGGPNAQQSLQKYLTRQMEPPFFPVAFHLLKARFKFDCHEPSGPAECHARLVGDLGSLRCHSIPLNHPNGGYGFKFTEQGRTFVFLTDNELDYEHQEGVPRGEYVEFCRGADLLIHDSQYTAEEYQITRGWGHTTYGDACDLAVEAGVKRLGLFHHDPDRTDDQLDQQVLWCRQRILSAGGGLEVFACAEGMTVEV